MPSTGASGAYENLGGAGHDIATEIDGTAVSVSTGQLDLVGG
jgi:hypothetical protein